jgi:predicted amidohydrolase
VDVLQISYGDDEGVDARRERVVAMVRERRGADLVVLPELWPHGGFSYRDWAACAEPVDGPTATAVAQAAAEIGAVVHAGSIIERDGESLYNTALLFGPDGGTLARYRKIHRFGFGAGEPLLLEPGDELVTVAIDVRGHGALTVGLATCYDLRFPEMFRGLLDAGAQVVLVPAAWPAARVHHWTLLARARAVEDQVVVVAANTAGTHAGTPMGGLSIVVGPMGEVLAEAGSDQEVLVAEVDPGEVAAVRERFPVLADRRLR